MSTICLLQQMTGVSYCLRLFYFAIVRHGQHFGYDGVSIMYKTKLSLCMCFIYLRPYVKLGLQFLYRGSLYHYCIVKLLMYRMTIKCFKIILLFFLIYIL